MARFPIRELEVLRLATDVSRGLATNAELFVAPPSTPQQIDEALAAFNAARDAAIDGAAGAARSQSMKEEAFRMLSDRIKGVLRYAEGVRRGDQASLQLLGWGRRKSPVPQEAPGQAVLLEVIREGSTWVTLGWKAPVEGGEVTAYRIQRRKRNSGDWADVGSSVALQATLNGQEAGIEWEYQVIAMNKAGDGPASNSVRAVL